MHSRENLHRANHIVRGECRRDAELSRRLILHYRAQCTRHCETQRSREEYSSICMNDRPSDGRGTGREGPSRHVRSKCR